MTTRGLLVAALIGLGSLRPAAGQEAAAPAPAEACSAEVFRQFDFWLGEWRVRNPAGAEVGTNHITRQAGGCAIREQWVGRDGVPGMSLNYFDRQTSTWHQEWVGGDGVILHLTGGMEGDEMVLGGPRNTPQGEVIDRIRWKPLDDGRVRQAWEVSADGGQTWSRIFLGFYEKE